MANETMSTNPRDSAGSMAWAFGAAAVAGTLLPAAAFVELSGGHPPSVVLVVTLLTVFVALNVHAAVYIGRKARHLRNERWRNLTQMLIVPWLLNVLLVATFIGADLVR